MVAIVRADQRRGTSERRPARHSLFTVTNPATCGIWARVSTDEQETGNQLAELRQWAARRGLAVTAEYVLGGASAWKGEHGDQLAAALADARLGKFDVLLVWALDRLDRGGVESTLGLLRRFHEARSPVWSLREPWTETADARTAELLGAIYAWMARAESARRSERIRAGLARRKTEGKPVGRAAGAKDSKPRRRSGYYARWEREKTVISDGTR
jgi:DNA invertase Pin-like site-specific DNA recombinase